MDELVCIDLTHLTDENVCEGIGKKCLLKQILNVLDFWTIWWQHGGWKMRFDIYNLIDSTLCSFPEKSGKGALF